MIHDCTLYKHLISDENIYLSIFSLNSYVNNTELLSYSDKCLLNELIDKYNEIKIDECISKVRNVINRLINENDFFINCRVYFKPKKCNEKNEIEFRPLHTTNIINQIALVSMLNLLIYEPNEDKLMLSSLSRLIPSNFYGNRVSQGPETLYKPWNKQYKKYTSISNELFAKFHKNEEYRYEVCLDIKNFFPSINPEVLYNYIVEKLPVTLKDDNLKLVKQILIKLLYCRIEEDNLNDKTIKKYYSNQDVSKITKTFVMGIPQGLPQSYFFANIYMIEIGKKFTHVFGGKSLYYVDDSVIFTNSLYEKENDFQTMLHKVNDLIKDFMKEYYNEDESYIKEYNLELYNFNKCIDYKVKVHDENEKSTYTDILTANKGEIYLKNISREASKTGFDINTSYSDEEEKVLNNRITTLLSEINNEMDLVKKRIENDNLDERIDIDKEENYLKKLIRYKKYFKYRKNILDYRESNDFQSIGKELISSFLSFLNNNDSLNEFFRLYNEDILEATIYFVLSNEYKYERKSENLSTLINLLRDLNIKLFGYDNNESSYISKLYLKYERGEVELHNVSLYETLSKKIEIKFPRAKRMHEKNILNYYMEKIHSLKTADFWNKMNIFNEDFHNTIIYVDTNTDEIKRNILNAFFSYIFNVEINDTYNFSKKENRMINYKELRILSYVRNRYFNYNNFKNNIEKFSERENSLKIDYNILEVIRYFRTFVKEPDLVDNLILIHKYTCDVWKNGSKYLYFYTLHNQEHAVDLIKSSVEIVKIINFIQISKIDYYILFIACYLHDISMVTLPKLDEFQVDSPESNKIYIEFQNDLERIKPLNDSRKIKKLLKDYYKRIDEFYETRVRNNHAKDSAYEIRQRSDLDFIDKCLRDVIAEVAEAHGYNVFDIYKVKSVASNHLVSKKYMKIILRLADLLDMSSYRVSRPILNNNLSNMSEISSFHWLSHLITDGYNFKVEYIPEYIMEERSIVPNSFLKNKSIIEVITLVIEVNLSQLTQEKVTTKCKNVNIRDDINEEGFTLNCGEECTGEKCNFLCKWITNKNYYLFQELQALQCYLNDIPDNYFKSKIHVQIKINSKTDLSSQQFEIINRFINK
ncbi:hypothetical protein FDB30_00640 [Clostridium botulinum]|uniref:HD domain-containing protein n=1 Tax=Clostridium botulinum TaxID=1491 RepID=UPI000774D1BA|nr:reverse transcriptase domain-containing protein [Clostridium botulinum]NFE72851.1 hypothetical protein [Clostridium botulinum]NFG36616.1 hypothetical protein [Clostridium botulinum]NFN99393.1 hypothetical protein [Clostridium botulinum]